MKYLSSIEIKDLKKTISNLSKLDFLEIEEIKAAVYSEYIIKIRVFWFPFKRWWSTSNWLFQILKDKMNNKFYTLDLQNVFKLDDLEKIKKVLGALK